MEKLSRQLAIRIWFASAARTAYCFLLTCFGTYLLIEWTFFTSCLVVCWVMRVQEEQWLSIILWERHGQNWLLTSLQHLVYLSSQISKNKAFLIDHRGIMLKEVNWLQRSSFMSHLPWFPHLPYLASWGLVILSLGRSCRRRHDSALTAQVWKDQSLYLLAAAVNPTHSGQV